jgi:hypothetical protein
LTSDATRVDRALEGIDRFPSVEDAQQLTAKHIVEEVITGTRSEAIDPGGRRLPLSYAASESDLGEALARLAVFVK